jgi:hypothetical protein
MNPPERKAMPQEAKSHPTNLEEAELAPAALR